MKRKWRMNLKAMTLIWMRKKRKKMNKAKPAKMRKVKIAGVDLEIHARSSSSKWKSCQGQDQNRQALQKLMT